MAKTSTPKSGGTSHIRFIMVEAELADGDVSQITQAIQNALRGHSPTVQRVALPQAKAVAHDGAELEIEETEEPELIEPETLPARESKPRAHRRPPPAPTVLELDMKSGNSLEDYAKGVSSSVSDRRKFLLIAAWFKQHRGLDAITVDHVYTGFRSLKWSVAINDFSQPLRNLKAEKLMTSPVSPVSTYGADLRL